jgi:hypothetical protein
MLCRTVLPLSKAVPMSARLIIIRSNYPVAHRLFHMSSLQNVDSKATYATIAPEKHSSKIDNIPPPPTKEDKTVAKVEAKPITSDVHEKRDFHWAHPVYTREEYEAIQVFSLLSTRLIRRLVIMKPIHLANTLLLQLQKFSVQDSISSLDTNILQVYSPHSMRI